MATSETIREFLVKLGFTVDDQTERKFTGSMRSAMLQAKLLGDAVENMARVVGEGLQKVAQSFDGLYWASERTGASVENIRALSYAVSQLGGTYEGARGAIEAFGQHLRSNPGYASMLRSLGVNTSENGKMRDQVAIMEDLGKALSRKPYAQALQYANALGIDENTMRALMSGDLQRNLEHYNTLQKSLGFDNQKAAESAKQFMNSMREAQTTIETVVAKILTDLEPAMTKLMNEFSEWVVQHGPEIEKALVQLGSVVSNVATDFSTLIDELKPIWEGFDKITQSIVGKDGLTVAIEALVGAYALGKLIRLLALLGGGGGSGGVASLLGWGAAGIGATAAILEAGKNHIESDPAMAQRTADGNSWIKRTGQRIRSWFGGSPSSKGTTLTNSQRDLNALETYRMARQAGLTHNAALGILGSEDRESGFNPSATGDGGLGRSSFQWHPDRQREILAGTGIDVTNPNISHADAVRAMLWEGQFGSDPGARRAFELMKNAQTPGEAAAAFSNNFERPLDRNGEAYRRGISANRFAGMIPSNYDFSSQPLGGGPTAAADNSRSVSQTTNINVVGATDPTAMANAIEKKQHLVNLTMQRNMQGAVR